MWHFEAILHRTPAVSGPSPSLVWQRCANEMIWITAVCLYRVNAFRAIGSALKACLTRLRTDNATIKGSRRLGGFAAQHTAYRLGFGRRSPKRA